MHVSSTRLHVSMAAPSLTLGELARPLSRTGLARPVHLIALLQPSHRIFPTTASLRPSFLPLFHLCTCSLSGTRPVRDRKLQPELVRLHLFTSVR